MATRPIPTHLKEWANVDALLDGLNAAEALHRDFKVALDHRHYADAAEIARRLTRVANDLRDISDILIDRRERRRRELDVTCWMNGWD